VTFATPDLRLKSLIYYKVGLEVVISYNSQINKVVCVRDMFAQSVVVLQLPTFKLESNQSHDFFYLLVASLLSDECIIFLF